jgi:hypothetical protein
MSAQAIAIIQHDIEIAIANNIAIGKYFSLVDEKGFFMTPSQNSVCHPLETVIIGQKIRTFINQQIAEELNVDLTWVDGFVDAYVGPKGLAEVGKIVKRRGQTYREGYCDGRKVVGIIRELESSRYCSC